MDKKRRNRKSLIRGMIMLIMLLVANIGATAKEIFAELTAMPHVESTFISGRVGTSMMTVPEVARGAKNGVWIDSDFKAMFIYRCYSEDSVKKARELLSNYVKSNNNVELVMRTRQGMQEYSMYEVVNAGARNTDNRAKLIIWNEDAPNVCQIVVIDWEELPDLSDITKAGDPLRFIAGLS
ncbi:MAG: hypothetical protein K2G67_06735 [Muribaculaceae bacterium]|nr:hypothetical protein [Muribaculaceae bacterium]